MRRTAAVLVLITFLLYIPLAGPVMAGPFWDAAKAYDRGDYETAYRLFKALAEQGDADAQLQLGDMYFLGQGVPKNNAEGMKWYRRSAEQGYTITQAILGDIYSQGKVVPQDYAEAAKWYRKAAEQGIAYAQLQLGLLYNDGQGVQQDFSEAVKWYRKEVVPKIWTVWKRI